MSSAPVENNILGIFKRVFIFFLLAALRGLFSNGNAINELKVNPVFNSDYFKFF
jgi:hypothetical protein